VLPLLDEIEREDTMGVFRLNANADKQAILAVLEAHYHDPA
jgi:hypothetical protein